MEKEARVFLDPSPELAGVKSQPDRDLLVADSQFHFSATATTVVTSTERRRGSEKEDDKRERESGGMKLEGS